MAENKFVKANEEIAETVVSGYKKIEDGVVGGYKKIDVREVTGSSPVSSTTKPLFSREKSGFS